jgi:hypothetical protein
LPHGTLKIKAVFMTPSPSSSRKTHTCAADMQAKEVATALAAFDAQVADTSPLWVQLEQVSQASAETKIFDFGERL